MRVIFALFDSLNRSALGAYGGDIGTPNFDRFAKRSITFDNHYTGSLPCMPARRDMHTGRLSFLHRSWGPLEPFDNSFAHILGEHGTYTHLVSDHYHYFEDGGAGYHTRYQSYDFIRGQEYDPWKAMVESPIVRFKTKYADQHYSRKPSRYQHAINFEHAGEERQQPGPLCFEAGFEFLDQNKTADNWFLQLEMFDPHEPFSAPDRFRQAGDSDYEGPLLNWPEYERASNSESEIREIRANYAALVRMCDEYFGKLLDYMDENDMWKDTALILSTDHGYLLAEHGWWGKCRMPYYEEITHIPLIMHHPDLANLAGTRTDVVTQTPDLMPTFLEFFGASIPEEVLATSLQSSLKKQEQREVIFGIFGGAIGITDGRYAFYHYPPDITAEGLHEYTLLPQHMTQAFSLDELKTLELAEPFDFTKGIKTLKIKALMDAQRIPQNDGIGFDDTQTVLYDLKTDPKQLKPIIDQEISDRLYKKIIKILGELDVPSEIFDWYGLEPEVLQNTKDHGTVQNDKQSFA